MSVVRDDVGDVALCAVPRPAPGEAAPARVGVIAVGAVLALALGTAVELVAGYRLLLLYGIGLALGGALFHSRFGFTSGWRQLVAVGQGRAVRTHMLMLAVACVFFAVLLSARLTLNGAPLQPALQPVGWGVVIGAFLFGAGMQIGGSCASGTLFAVGSGQTAIVFTLSGFIAGSVLAIGTWPLTAAWQSGPVISLAATPFGYGGALVISLLAMALIAGITYVIGRRRNPPPPEEPASHRGWARVLRGTWPMWVGAIVLAVLNALTLYTSGSPWGITGAFGLWGSKMLGAVGVDVAHWQFWTLPKNAPSLRHSVLADKVSVMDFGIMIGALVASAAGGAFVLHRAIPWRTALGAVLGGVLMGFGARVSGGCNIGAYFSGVASFSLHGWLWGAMAIVGTYAGLMLRPLFGLTNPKPTDSIC